jgi:hypothetical protein
MATMIEIEYPKAVDYLTKRFIERWAEQQGGAVFLSFDARFVITDYSHNHHEMSLLAHILNCENLRYRCVTNIELDGLFAHIWENTLNKKTKNNKKGA